MQSFSPLTPLTLGPRSLSVVVGLDTMECGAASLAPPTGGQEYPQCEQQRCPQMLSSVPWEAEPPPENPCFMASLTSTVTGRGSPLAEERIKTQRGAQTCWGTQHTGWSQALLQAPSRSMILGPRGKRWAVHTPSQARFPGTGRRSPGHATVATSEGSMPGQCHHLSPVGTARKEEATQNWAPGQKVEAQAWGWPLGKKGPVRDCTFLPGLLGHGCVCPGQ